MANRGGMTNSFIMVKLQHVGWDHLCPPPSLTFSLATMTLSPIGNEIICLSVYLCRNTLARGSLLLVCNRWLGGHFTHCWVFFSHSIEIIWGRWQVGTTWRSPQAHLVAANRIYGINTCEYVDYRIVRCHPEFWRFDCYYFLSPACKWSLKQSEIQR